MDDLDGVDVLDKGQADGVSRSCVKARVRIPIWLLCPDYAGN